MAVSWRLPDGGGSCRSVKRVEPHRRPAFLAEHAAHVEAIFDHAFQFLGLLAPDGTLLEANQRALDFAAVARSEVIGKAFWETPWWRHDPAQQLTLRQAIEDAARGRFVRFEATHCDAESGVATFDFSLTPIKDAHGNVVLIVPEGRDITERKHAGMWQEVLAEAAAVLTTPAECEEMLRTIGSLAVQAVADCCIMDLFDDAGEPRRTVVVHGAVVRPWFADALECMPVRHDRPDLVWSALAAKRPILMPRVTARDVESLAHDEDHRRALTALGVTSLMALPLVARGRLLGTLVMVSSHASRLYGPDDLRHAQHVADRIAIGLDNARLHRAEQKAIAARDEVLGIVAHDLRNPLSGIEATAAVVRRLLDRGALEAACQAVDGIVRASKRANRLVQDLLEVRRLSAGRLVLRRAPMLPAQLVVECVDAHMTLASAAGIALVAEAPAGLPAVSADRDRILQVLENLVGNALKFTPAGGSIRVGAVAREHEVVFLVSDTGPGIAPHLLGSLFQPFWQARPDDLRGLGLGLSIAREVIAAHGGRIWAESQLGIGSTFFFSLPLA
jgi:PAS domain S-box-containing protein